MKPPEAFGVVVRTIGLLILIYAVPAFCWTLVLILSGSVPDGVWFWAAAGTALMGLVGLWMLRGAPGIIAFTYPEERRYPKNSQELIDWMDSGKGP